VASLKIHLVIYPRHWVAVADWPAHGAHQPLIPLSCASLSLLIPTATARSTPSRPGAASSASTRPTHPAATGGKEFPHTRPNCPPSPCPPLAPLTTCRRPGNAPSARAVAPQSARGAGRSTRNWGHTRARLRAGGEPCGGLCRVYHVSHGAALGERAWQRVDPPCVAKPPCATSRRLH